MSRYLNLAWLLLRLSFVLILLVVFSTGLSLLILGNEFGRRAIAGLLILPPFMIFYLSRFQEIRLTAWSVLAHIGTIVCLGFITLLATKVISVHAPGMLLALGVSILGFAGCVARVAYAAGWKN
jgi:hypothetical protein